MKHTILPRIIPTLLLRGEGLVKTVGFKNPVYVGDPINTLNIFNEKQVDEIVILDITATTEKRAPNIKKIKELASECFMPMCYGGGISSITQIEEILGIGVEKVTLNTIIYEKPSIVSDAAKEFGSQSIIASIDVKKGLFGKSSVYSNCGHKNRKLSAIEQAKIVESKGAGEIILNSIDLDGTGRGYDLELIQAVSEAVSIPVVALGGVGKSKDLLEGLLAGASAVSAGSHFVFHGKHRAVLITYPSEEEILEMAKINHEAKK